MCIEKRHHYVQTHTVCSYSTLSQAQPQTIGFKPPPPPPPWAAKWTCDMCIEKRHHVVSRCQENITYGVQNSQKKSARRMPGKHHLRGFKIAKKMLCIVVGSNPPPPPWKKARSAPVIPGYYMSMRQTKYRSDDYCLFTNESKCYIFWTKWIPCTYFHLYAHLHIPKGHFVDSLAHPARRARWAMVWRPSSVHPSVLPSVHSFQNASSLSFLNRFWFWLFHKIGLGGGFKTSTQNREIHYRSMVIYANLFEITKKCFFSFISRPILIWFALSGRANFGTLNFYTEFWDFSPLINYGNLCKFIIKKNCFSLISWPIFILFVLSDRARWGL